MRHDFPLPDRSWPLTAGFWDAAARRELAIPRCDRCGTWVWYPKPECPSCGGTAMPWTATAGTGRLYSWTTVHHTFLPAFAEMVPYCVGLVALDEDPAVRVTARLLDDPDELAADAPMAVEFCPLEFVGVEGTVLAPWFRLGATSAST
jgi:uncharacterized OB-fold protein